MFFEQQIVAREKKASGQGNQEHSPQPAQEAAVQRGGQAELRHTNFLHVLPIAHPAD